MKQHLGALLARNGVGILLVCLLVMLTPASAVQPGPRPGAAQSRQFIVDLGAQAVQILRQPGRTLEQRETVFRGILAQKFDLDFIGRTVLGQHLLAATLDQREEYQYLFAEFVLRTYSAQLAGYIDEELIVQSAMDAGQHDVVVSSLITGGAREPVKTQWRVRMIKDQLKIIDVNVAGFSLIITQKEEFAAVVRRYGMEGLLEVLRARTGAAPAEGTE